MGAERLLVAAGDRVQVCGVLVRTATGWGMEAGLRGRRVLPELVRPAGVPNTAQLETAGPLEGAGPAEGALVGQCARAVGRWEPPAVCAESIAVLPLGAGAPVHEVAVARPGRRPGAGPVPAQGPHRPGQDDASALMRELYGSGPHGAGALVALGPYRQSDGRVVTLAAAHDVATVTRALRPVFGELLRVVPARWPARSYRAAHAWTESMEGLGMLASLTSPIVGADGQGRIRVLVHHLDREAIRAAGAPPVGPMWVSAVVRPARRDRRSPTVLP